MAVSLFSFLPQRDSVFFFYSLLPAHAKAFTGHLTNDTPDTPPFQILEMDSTRLLVCEPFLLDMSSSDEETTRWTWIRI